MPLNIRLRLDVNAVVHAHPPYATGYAVAGLALDKALLPEVILAMGCIPLAEYSTPTTEEVARVIRGLVPGHDALLLSNHGAVTYGKDLETAYYRMETLEHFARISIVAKILGRERVLSEDDLRRLYASQYKASGGKHGCKAVTESWLPAGREPGGSERRDGDPDAKPIV